MSAEGVAARFNDSGSSRWINRPAGRVFRLAAGVGFATAGFLLRDTLTGTALMAWALAPLTAGAFDLCYISGVLGGPFKGSRIRELQGRSQQLQGARA
jgi:hypothetical protein